MKTVLVVDDNPDILECFEDILSSSGYTVITCRDGQAALITVHEGLSVDLIITDYHMPGMNGLELITQLKRHAPAIPVIMCSVQMRTDVYLKTLGLGVIEYLEKPVSPNELRRAVAAALDGAAKQHTEPGRNE